MDDPFRYLKKYLSEGPFNPPVTSRNGATLMQQYRDACAAEIRTTLPRIAREVNSQPVPPVILNSCMFDEALTCGL